MTCIQEFALKDEHNLHFSKEKAIKTSKITYILAYKSVVIFKVFAHWPAFKSVQFFYQNWLTILDQCIALYTEFK
jgi:hypothetical protein